MDDRKSWQELRNEILASEPYDECRWCCESEEEADAELRDEATLVREVEDYLRDVS